MSKSSRRRKRNARRKRNNGNRPKVRSEIAEPNTQSDIPPSTTTPVCQVRLGTRIRAFPKKLMALALGIATLLGYVVLAPRLSVEPPSAGTDPSNPFNEPFTLNNDGYFSLYDVKATCAEPGISGIPAPGVPFNPSPKHPFALGAMIVVHVFSTPKLEPEDPRSFLCNSFTSVGSMGVPFVIRHSWVKISVEFKLFRFVPWWSKSFPFRAELKDGQLHWSHHPWLPEPPSSAPSRSN